MIIMKKMLLAAVVALGSLSSSVFADGTVMTFDGTVMTLQGTVMTIIGTVMT